MKQTFIKGLIEKTATGSYRVLASTAATDRQGDIIDQGGWELENYMKNPVMLWAHDYSSLPVAKALQASIVTGLGLVLDYEFAPAEANPMAQQVKALVDGGFLNAVSVGFMPKERSGKTITKSELLEVSFVPVPANQEALQLAVKTLTDTGVAATEAEAVVAKFLTLKEDKGPVADEIAAEEAMEAKWDKLDEVWEVLSAFCDVYLDEATPVEAFSSLLLEVVGLLTAVAGDDGADDDAVVTAALRERMVSKIAELAGKGRPATVGALFALVPVKTAATIIAEKIVLDLKGKQVAPEEEEKEDEDEDELEEELDTETETSGAEELRALLVVRGMLGDKENTSRHALSAVKALIDARRSASIAH